MYFFSELCLFFDFGFFILYQATHTQGLAPVFIALVSLHVIISCFTYMYLPNDNFLEFSSLKAFADNKKLLKMECVQE